MQISLIIPSWRREEALVRCLRGIEGQERVPEEVVVVVREDDEQTAAVLAGLETELQIRGVRPSGPGLVAAVNAGLDHVTGDLIVLTDDDTVARPDWIARIERHFETDPRLGGLGGRDWLSGSHPVNGRVKQVGTVTWFGRVIGNHHLGSGPPREVDVLKGANMAFRAAAANGLRMDRGLRGVGVQQHSDMDLSMAVKAAGWRLVYDPKVAVDHYEGRRYGSEREDRMTPRDREDASHNLMLVLAKHLDGSRRIVAIAYGLAVGTRDNPGPILALERLARERPRRAVAARAAAATRGRIAAFRTLLRR